MWRGLRSRGRIGKRRRGAGLEEGRYRRGADSRSTQKKMSKSSINSTRATYIMEFNQTNTRIYKKMLWVPLLDTINS